MKSRFRQVVFFTLIATFALSTFLCCCFSDTSEAYEVKKPSCHEQTSEQSSIPQESEECECGSYYLAVEKQDINAPTLPLLIFLPLDESFSICSIKETVKDPYVLPIYLRDTSNLYILNEQFLI